LGGRERACRRLSPTDPGQVEIGFYFVENATVTMCNEHGKPTGKNHKLMPADDANQIARRFTKDLWRSRTKELGGFHRQIVYPPWNPA
jgi:hypothetical protein